jgi:hypothetical protein
MDVTFGNARDFNNGRQLADWLGLTPTLGPQFGKARGVAQPVQP